MSAYFDTQIRKALALLESFTENSYDPQELELWPTVAQAPFVLSRDSGLELGRQPDQSVNFFAVTQDKRLLDQGTTVRVFGPELDELQAAHGDYGKLVLVLTQALSEEDPYTQIKDLELEALRLHLQGIMTRASAEQSRENLRISKQALSEGVSFARMGATLAHHYAKQPLVRGVKVITLSGAGLPYTELQKLSDEVRSILRAMNTLLDNLLFDCDTCALSPLCDEVEGLRELHKNVQSSPA